MICLIEGGLLKTVAVFKTLKAVENVIVGFGFFAMKIVEGVMNVLDAFLSHVGVFHAEFFELAFFLFLSVFFLHE
jgi:hypothetical protein